MKRWATADEHYNHAKIIEYCNRPFIDLREMNNDTINNHNSVVGNDDIVYHVGDFAFGRFEDIKRIVDRLNGIHILILGSHDDLKPFTYVKAGFQSIHTSLQLSNIVLAHDPAVATVARQTTFLCGHVHGLFQIAGNVINVGVDVRNFCPVEIEKLGIAGYGG